MAPERMAVPVPVLVRVPDPETTPASVVVPVLLLLSVRLAPREIVPLNTRLPVEVAAHVWVEVMDTGTLNVWVPLELLVMP